MFGRKASREWVRPKRSKCWDSYGEIRLSEKVPQAELTEPPCLSQKERGERWLLQFLWLKSGNYAWLKRNLTGVEPSHFLALQASQPITGPTVSRDRLVLTTWSFTPKRDVIDVLWSRRSTSDEHNQILHTPASQLCSEQPVWLPSSLNPNHLPWAPCTDGCCPAHCRKTWGRLRVTVATVERGREMAAGHPRTRKHVH